MRVRDEGRKDEGEEYGHQHEVHEQKNQGTENYIKRKGAVETRGEGEVTRKKKVAS